MRSLMLTAAIAALIAYPSLASEQLGSAVGYTLTANEFEQMQGKICPGRKDEKRCNKDFSQIVNSARDVATRILGVEMRQQKFYEQAVQLKEKYDKEN